LTPASGRRGKHQRGNARQIGTLLDLRKLGDAALVVERDEEWVARRGRR
jgi:excinuclease UvrABC ATPase subunit